MRNNYENGMEHGSSCQENNFRGGFSNFSTSVEQAENRENKCCCKKSMKAALKLLCDAELSELIDFDKFAFLTEDFIVGARLATLKGQEEEKDNLSSLNGSFQRFSPCNCDLIDIGGSASYNFPLPKTARDLEEQIKDLIKDILHAFKEQPHGSAAESNLETLITLAESNSISKKIWRVILDFLIEYFTVIPEVDTASLCAINAIAFQVKASEMSGGKEPRREELSECNYQKAKALLQAELDETCNENCDECKPHCRCDDCCCTKGILKELFTSNLSRKVTLTAGNLVIREATILGVKGDVLVLANDKKKRFYFVCANAVQFLE